MNRLFFTPLLLVLAWSCAGLSAGAAPDHPEMLTAFAAFPAPVHSTSAGSAGLVAFGSDYGDQLPFNMVERDGERAAFAPAWISSEANSITDLAYATYQFDMTDYSGDPTVEFLWEQPPGGDNQLYAGLYDQQRSSWTWHNSDGMNKLELENLLPFSLNGALYLAVALTGTQPARLYQVAVGTQDAATDLPIDEISLPPGFEISVFSDDVPNARGMVLSDQGTLYVGSRSARRVHAVRDFNSDGIADEVITVAANYDSAVGVDLMDGDLYFSNYDKIWRIDDIEESLGDIPDPVLVADFFPTETHHGWKFIRFGPDGKLYVPIGAPCNICDEGDPYASITRINADGSGWETVARGVRNTVGFDWHPVTGELWFTDNGRDMLGDNVPPDELNRLATIPDHFGYPYFHGSGIADPVYGTGRNSEDYTEPAMPLGPHVAALGMRFYTGDQFPAEYHNQAFIAEHGSWNRTEPLGARVTLVRIAADNQTATAYEVFAEGWQRPDGTRWGRPADVLVAPDGSLLVSDDLAGAVYRITYVGLE